MEIVSKPEGFIPEEVLNAPPNKGGNLAKGGNQANETYIISFR